MFAGLGIYLATRFPRAVGWATSQMLPAAVLAFSLLGLVICWQAGSYLKERRVEARAAAICKADELQAELDGIKLSLALKDLIIAHRTAALESATHGAEQLAEELKNVREAHKTPESGSRVFVPAGDGWLLEWQGRGKGAGRSDRPRARPVS